MIQKEEIVVETCSTRDMIADPLTKSLNAAAFTHLRRQLLSSPIELRGSVGEPARSTTLQESSAPPPPQTGRAPRGCAHPPRGSTPGSTQSNAASPQTISVSATSKGDQNDD